MRCDENLCQLRLILDTGFWILDNLDIAVCASLKIQHPVSSIEHLSE